MTNKERIIELSKHFNTTEVAEICKVSVSYVCRVLRQHNPNTLTLINYIKALKSGTTAKTELAALFEVERTTIFRFEKMNETKQSIGQMLYIDGMNIEELKNTLNLTNQEAAELSKLPTLPGVILKLKQMLNALEKYKDLTPFHSELYSNIFNALKALEC